MTSVLPPARRTRPPNRPELILAAATELFAASLLAAVSAADLTGTGGLTALAGFVIDNRHVTALMGREVPHLGEAARGRPAVGTGAGRAAAGHQDRRPAPGAAGAAGAAVFAGPVTVEEVLASPRISGPLTRLQCCPPAGGAAAAVLGGYGITLYEKVS
ncbi:MAG TPA: hypothetical protein VFQ68_46125 [Streptosporangiaceae bacterium]|nr:hypothetical protein [Streptosporangiaceae bacterium]